MADKSPTASKQAQVSKKRRTDGERNEPQQCYGHSKFTECVRPSPQEQSEVKDAGAAHTGKLTFPEPEGTD